MTVTKEVNAYNFEFWSGGKDTAEELTLSEIDTVFNWLENQDGIWSDILFAIWANELFKRVEKNLGYTISFPMTETEVNDFFWFGRDEIAQFLGYHDFDEIMERNKA